MNEEEISNAVSSIECTNIADTIDGVQQVNASFDPLKRISEKEGKHEGEVKSETYNGTGKNKRRGC